MWALHFIACPAEQLGIELPEGGAKGISHEDLRRDVRLLVETTDPTRAFLERMAQMKFEPAIDMPACVQRGTGDDYRIGVSRPTNAMEATAAAAVISIAKAWDLGTPPSRRVLVCMGAEYPADTWVAPLVDDPTLDPATVNFTALAEKVRVLYADIDGAAR